MSDFLMSLFFILIMIIFSGVFRTLLSKNVKKKFDQTSDNEADNEIIYNDNTNYEKEIKQEEVRKPDIIELFQEYSLKKKNEIFSKDAYINKNTIYLDQKEKENRKKEKENIVSKRKLKQKEKSQSYERETLVSLNKKIEDDSISSSLDKEAAFERIKKLSYFKQAIILSEILGPPKGLDL